jgi:hypothetical protein
VFLTTLALPEALLVIEKLGVLTVNLAIVIAPATYFVTFAAHWNVSSVFSNVILSNRAHLKLDANVIVGVPATVHSMFARILTSEVLETYISSFIVNTPAAVGPSAVYVDQPISSLSSLITPLALAAVILKSSNLIGSETVNVPFAISTSVDPAAASTDLAKLESEVRVNLPQSNL